MRVKYRAKCVQNACKKDVLGRCHGTAHHIVLHIANAAAAAAAATTTTTIITTITTTTSTTTSSKSVLVP